MRHSTWSRRSFSRTLIAAPWVLRAQTTPARARIKVDTERVIDEIDPKIYGNFIEHLGRCIEGGVFEENSPLSDANGYRRDVLDAAKKLGVSILRWPGGNFASNYQWKDGIGPRDQRPRRLEMAWGTVEDNRFGTHEFLQYCEMLGAEPYICANLGTGSGQDAQQWVEYVNSSQDTAMTRLRKQNGRAEPWKVTYWALGNEIDGPWQMGHKSAEDYGKFALEAAKLMKWTDPNIKLVAAGSSNFGSNIDWVGWNRTVLEFLKSHADYLSMHTYVGNAVNDFGEFLASSMLLEDRIKTTEGVIRAALNGQPRSRKIHIAWDEWNVWYRARGDAQRGRRILEERYSLEDALVVATFLNAFVNNAHIVKIANMAQLVNVIAPIFTDEKRMFLQTIYYPLALFAANTRGKALELLVKSPSYSSRTLGDVPYLDASASIENGTLVVNVVNRHRDQVVEVDLEIQDRQFGPAIEVVEVNAADIKAENSFDETKVSTTRRSVKPEPKVLRYSFAAHSYTMLKAKLA